MNPEIKKRWLEALRGGKYKQGVNCLRSESVKGEVRHCCLGVLTDIYLKERKRGWWTKLLPAGKTTTIQLMSHKLLPKAVMKWAGLKDPNPVVGKFNNNEPCKPYTLAGHNDSGKSFTEIAKLIENKL